MTMMGVAHQWVVVKLAFCFIVLIWTAHGHLANVRLRSGTIVTAVSDGKSSNSGCQCIKYDCGCCVTVDIPKIGLNDTACVNVTYLSEDYGISLTLSLDDKVLINETLSARNPPPVCVGVPYLEKELSICVDLYNLQLSDNTFSGCVQLQVRFLDVVHEDYPLGCFKMPIPLASTHQQYTQALLDHLQAHQFKRGGLIGYNNSQKYWH